MISDPIGSDPTSVIKSDPIRSDIEDITPDWIGSDITDIESNRIRSDITDIGSDQTGPNIFVILC